MWITQVKKVKIWKVLLLEVYLLVGFFNRTLSMYSWWDQNFEALCKLELELKRLGTTSSFSQTFVIILERCDNGTISNNLIIHLLCISTSRNTQHTLLSKLTHFIKSKVYTSLRPKSSSTLVKRPKFWLARELRRRIKNQLFTRIS